jgi:tricorn protease-like protein
VWLAAAAIAVAIAGAAAWFGLGHSEISPTAERMTRLTFEPGLQTDPSLSPDGTFVAYSSNQKGNFDIYIRPVADANAKAVQVTTDPAHDWQPHWSIDDQLVFRSERDGGGLYVVSRTGGHERRVAPFGHQPQWSPDGSRILFSSWMTDSLYVVGRDGGTPQELRVRGSVFGAYGWAGDARHVALLTTGGHPSSSPACESST